MGLKLGTCRSVTKLPDYRQLHEQQENSNETAHKTHLLIIKKCTGKKKKKKKIIISVINFAVQPQNGEQSGQFIGILAGGDKAKNNNS